MKPHPLKVARDERGWSQSKLAKTIGVTTKTVIRWESGLAMPRLHHREELSRLFGKTMKELDLLSEMDKQQDGQEVEFSDEQSSEPESSEQDWLLDDPAIAEGLAAQQWLTN